MDGVIAAPNAWDSGKNQLSVTSLGGWFVGDAL